MTKEIKVTINLNQNVHSEPSTEVLVDDILWIAGKTNRPGCSVVLKKGITLKSTDDSVELRKVINSATAADDSPRRG